MSNSSGDITLPFNHRIEPLMQDDVDDILVRTNNLMKTHQMLKLCDKYGYKAVSIEPGLFKLVKKYIGE